MVLQFLILSVGVACRAGTVITVRGYCEHRQIRGLHLKLDLCHTITWRSTRDWNRNPSYAAPPQTLPNSSDLICARYLLIMFHRMFKRSNGAKIPCWRLRMKHPLMRSCIFILLPIPECCASHCFPTVFSKDRLRTRGTPSDSLLQLFLTFSSLLSRVPRLHYLILISLFAVFVVCFLGVTASWGFYLPISIPKRNLAPVNNGHKRNIFQ